MKAAAATPNLSGPGDRERHGTTKPPLVDFIKLLCLAIISGVVVALIATAMTLLLLGAANDEGATLMQGGGTRVEHLGE